MTPIWNTTQDHLPQVSAVMLDENDPEYLLQSYYDVQMEEGMPGVVMGDKSQFAVASLGHVHSLCL